MPELPNADLFFQLGLPGAMLFVLLLIIISGGFIIHKIVRELSKDRGHAEERWRETFVSVAAQNNATLVSVSQQNDVRQKETNEVIRDLTATVARLGK